MKTYECVEVCPHCMGENIIQWNTKELGFVAKCMHCGKKMMLCDECLHTVCQDGEPHDCDWCSDADGVCHRDTSPVELSTYGTYNEENDDQAELFFIVPKNWLWEYVKETEYKTLNSFLNEYTWDNSEPIYYEAKENNVIIKEWEV